LRAEALASRLTGVDGRGVARGRNRQRLADKLIAMGALPAIDMEASSEAESARAQRNRSDRARFRYDATLGPHSTRFAARGAEASWSLGAALRRDAIHASPVDVSAPLECPLAFVEDHAVLDARTLQRFAPTRRSAIVQPDAPAAADPLEGVWGVRLAWPPKMMGTVTDFTVAIDVAKGRPAVVQVRSVDGAGAVREQLIDLEIVERGGRTRWYLICPVSHRRCDRLFLRAGRFASAQAQRLIHRSQRVIGPISTP
jgi:hypothetical protein